MKFHDCVTAPSPRRVPIFLAEKGLTVPTVQSTPRVSLVCAHARTHARAN